MLQFVFILLALGLTGFGYGFRRPALSLAGAAIWLVFGVYNYTLSVFTWDIYYDLMILGISLFLVVIMEGFIIRPRQDQQDSAEDYYGRDMEDYATRRQNSRLWRDYMRTIAQGDADDRRQLRERRDKQLVIRANKRRVKPNGDIEWRED